MPSHHPTHRRSRTGSISTLKRAAARSYENLKSLLKPSMSLTPLRPSTPTPSAPFSTRQTNPPTTPASASASFGPASGSSRAKVLHKPRERAKSTSMANATQALSRRISYPITIHIEGQAERDDRTWGIRPETPRLSFPTSVTPVPGSPPRALGGSHVRGQVGGRGRTAAAVFEIFGGSEEDDTGEIGGVEEDLWANARYQEPATRPSLGSGECDDDTDPDPFRASPISTHFSIPSPAPAARSMSRSMSMGPTCASPGVMPALASPRPLRQSRPSLPTILSTYSEATTELSSRHGTRMSSRFSTFSDPEDDATTEAGHAPPEYQYQYRSTYTQLVDRPLSPDDTICSSRPASAIDFALPSPVAHYAPVTFTPRSGPRPRSQTWAAPPPVLDLHIATDSPTLPSFEWGRLTRQSVCSAFEAAGGEHWSPPPSPTPTPSPTLEAVTIGECDSLEAADLGSSRPASGVESRASSGQWVPFPRSRPVSGVSVSRNGAMTGTGVGQGVGVGMMSPPSSPGWLSQRAAARPRPARVAGGLGGQPWLLAPAPGGQKGRKGRPITATEEEGRKGVRDGVKRLDRSVSPRDAQRYSSPSSMLLFDKAMDVAVAQPALAARADMPAPPRVILQMETPLVTVQTWQRRLEPPFALPSGLVCPVPTPALSASPGPLAFPSQSDVQDFESAASRLSSRASASSAASSATEAGEGITRGEGEGERTAGSDFSGLWAGQGSPDTTATSWGSRDSWVVFPRAKGRRSV